MPAFPEAPHPERLALSRRVADFARLLRGLGLNAGPAETADALRAMHLLGVLNARQVQDALRMVFTVSRGQRPAFDAAYAQHFLDPQAELEESGAAMPPPPDPPAPPDGDVPPDEPPEDELPEDGPLGGPRTPLGAGAADEEPAGEGALLRSQLSPHAGQGGEARLGAPPPTLLAAADALIRAARLGRSRRWRAAARGRRFDFRRTLHAALRTGGDPASPRYLGRPRRHPRFLIVLDGSRSMAAHAALLLEYAQALRARSRRVEVYAFSTGLTRLTPLLEGHALTLPALGDAWGGGTRIGENLLRLARDERARLTPDTLTIVLSDGLDTGEPELLERAARELRRLGGGLVWLNPLAAQPGYLPLARGMAAALPHVDVFAPADGIEALAALPARLRRGR